MHKVRRDTLFTSRYVSSLFVGKTVWQGGLLNCWVEIPFFSLTSKLVLEYPEKYANNIMQVGNNWLYQTLTLLTSLGYISSNRLRAEPIFVG